MSQSYREKHPSRSRTFYIHKNTWALSNTPVNMGHYPLQSKENDQQNQFQTRDLISAKRIIYQFMNRIAILPQSNHKNHGSLPYVLRSPLFARMTGRGATRPIFSGPGFLGNLGDGFLLACFVGSESGDNPVFARGLTSLASVPVFLGKVDAW